MAVGNGYFKEESKIFIKDFCNFMNRGNVYIYHKSYEEFTEFDEDCFCYFDIPYSNTNCCYTESSRDQGNWTEESDYAFFRYCEDLNSKGIRFAISNVFKNKGAENNHLKEWCEKNNAVCAGLYADEGKSASKNIRKRKEIHRMLRDIRDGKIDLVIFTRFDRFTRNPEDYFKMMETMNAAGVQWKAIMQPELDLNTSMGQTLIMFYLGINRQESANISERNRATMAVRIQKGAPITGAHNLPISHTIGTDERGNKIVIKDPEFEPIVWTYINHYETHHSKRAAMEYTE